MRAARAGSDKWGVFDAEAWTICVTPPNQRSAQSSARATSTSGSRGTSSRGPSTRGPSTRGPTPASSAGTRLPNPIYRRLKDNQYCIFFNKNSCQEPGSHEITQQSGNSITVEHLCAKCDAAHGYHECTQP